MDKKKKNPLNVQATRETKKALSWAKQGIKAISDMERANPGIGYTFPKGQKKQLQAFVDKYEGKKSVMAKPVKNAKKGKSA